MEVIMKQLMVLTLTILLGFVGFAVAGDGVVSGTLYNGSDVAVYSCSQNPGNVTPGSSATATFSAEYFESSGTIIVTVDEYNSDGIWVQTLASVQLDSGTSTVSDPVTIRDGYYYGLYMDWLQGSGDTTSASATASVVLNGSILYSCNIPN